MNTEQQDELDEMIKSIPVDQKTGFLKITLYDLRKRVEELFESEMGDDMV